jgi:DNA repair exonuclease SbcCD ATPase subunit
MEMLMEKAEARQPTAALAGMLSQARRASQCAQFERRAVEEWMRWAGLVTLSIIGAAFKWMHARDEAQEQRHEKLCDRVAVQEGKVTRIEAATVTHAQLQESLDRVLSAQSQHVDRLVGAYTEQVRGMSIATRESLDKLERTVKDGERASQDSRDKIRDRLEEFGKAAAAAAERSGATESQVERLVEQVAEIAGEVQHVQALADAWNTAARQGFAPGSK